ncbi:MAG: sugar phosphate isomerase/epimerase [Fidelibacterota bacterium]|nr:MAG: sugar phosphate isomerase/epimerase [Candidatus Neomarinimicrobiota bacterium]
MIRILLNTIALEPHRWTAEKIPHFRLADLLSRIAEAGFHFVEVWQYHISTEDDKAVREIKQMGDDLGVIFPVVGAYPKLHLQDQAREQELEGFSRIVERASLLGARTIKIFVGSKGTDELTDDELEQSIDFLSQVLKRAQSSGLDVTGELHKKTLFDGVETTKGLLAKIGAGNFRICYQPYDFESTEQAIKDYTAVAESVTHVHFQGRKDKKYELLQNSEIDYALLAGEVVKHGFDGYFSIEFVKDCVVSNVREFDLQAVLDNARKDKEYLGVILKQSGAQYLG